LTTVPGCEAVRHPGAGVPVQRRLADIQRGHPRHQLGRLLCDLLHQTPPRTGRNHTPVAARESQQGRRGGIACSRQQWKTLAVAPGEQTNKRAHSTKQKRRRRATTPEFHARRTSQEGIPQLTTVLEKWASLGCQRGLARRLGRSGN
jgi:hypothetical protein